jgi:hypothetical protein
MDLGRREATSEVKISISYRPPILKWVVTASRVHHNPTRGYSHMTPTLEGQMQDDQFVRYAREAGRSLW